MSIKHGSMAVIASLAGSIALSGCTKEEPKPAAQLNKAASDLKSGADQAAKDTKTAADSAAKQVNEAAAANHQ